MINEISPVQISGILGSMVQNKACLGFTLACAIGFIVPYEFDQHGNENTEIYFSTVWRWTFLLPGIIALIQVLLLTTIFTYDTPVFYEKIHRFDIADEVYSRIYVEKETDTRLFKSISTINSTVDTLNNEDRASFTGKKSTSF